MSNIIEDTTYINSPKDTKSSKDPLSVEPCDISQVRNSSMLQSKEWTELKSSFAWQSYSYVQHISTGLEKFIVIHVRSISPFVKLAYVPDGLFPLNKIYELDSSSDSQAPDTKTTDTKDLESLLERAFSILALCLQDLLEKDSTILCLRWDMPWILSKAKELNLAQLTSYSRLLHAYKSFNKKNKSSRVAPCKHIQPPATMVLQLSKSEEELIKSMKQKTRYNIRLGEKKGLKIVEISMQEFYTLYNTTSMRNNISIHSKSYYEKVEEVFNSSKNYVLKIYASKYEDSIIAAIVVVFNIQDDAPHRTTVYLYGASSDEYRNLMPMYSLQWHAIQEAKKRGSHDYDMGGMSIEEDPQDRMYGLYKFKSGFGDRVQFRLSAFEIRNIKMKGTLYRKIVLTLFKLVESLRLWYYYKYKKR